MNLCDVNVWLSLVLSEHVHHRAARQWLDGVSAPRSVLFCRATQLAFLRLLTTAAVLAPYGNEPLGNDEAWRVFDGLLADDRIVLREEDPVGLTGHWRSFSSGTGASPKRWADAYLAAFALAGSHRIVTTDRAFAEFPGLDTLVLGTPS